MTIKTRLLNIAVFLVLLLTAMRGRLLYFVVRFGSAEYYAQTATESIQSSSKAITPQKKSARPCVPSLKSIPLPYENPNDLINDILRGKVSCDSVRLSEWMELCCMAMIDGRQPHLNLDMPHGGGLYSMHHCIKIITPPASVASIQEQLH